MEQVELNNQMVIYALCMGFQLPHAISFQLSRLGGSGGPKNRNDLLLSILTISADYISSLLASCQKSRNILSRAYRETVSNVLD